MKDTEINPRIFQYDDAELMRVVMIDSLPPEISGRLMALFSRDPSYVVDHFGIIKLKTS